MLSRAVADVLERMKGAYTKAQGQCWFGRKTPGPYMAYLPIAKGDRRIFPASNPMDTRVYLDRGGGWRVLNKPESRRKRHRREVALRKQALKTH